MRRGRLFVLVLAPCCLAACRSPSNGGDAGAEQHAAPIDAPAEAAARPTPKLAKQTGPVVVDGFATPESVVHDPVADVYLVSNINGAPDAKDENGFISRVSPSGELLAREWCTGEPSVTGRLNAPKGLAIVDEQLVVTDIDVLRFFDRSTGKPTLSISAGWEFLNDVVPDGEGGFLVTDTGREGEGEGVFRVSSRSRDARYVSHLLTFDELRPGAFPESPLTVTSIDTNAGLGGANGVALRGDQLLLATFARGELLELKLSVDEDAGAELGEPVALGEPGSAPGQLDGIVVLEDGRLLVSSWAKKAVYEVSPEGKWSALITDLEAPADIGYDAKRRRVLIPLFTTNQLVIHPL